MHRLWIAAVCLAAYGTGQAQTSTPSAQTRAAERAAIADKRAAITQAQMAGEQACRQRFAVEDCLKDVRDQARAELAPLAEQRFVVFHDAYGYFTAHYGLSPAIPVSLGDASAPAAARLSAVRDQIIAQHACGFFRRQFPHH